MPDEKIVRVPGVKYDPVPKPWEDDIIDAPHDAPRKAVWVPMDDRTRFWYVTRERSVHNLVNVVLRAHMESKLTNRKISSNSA